MTNNEFKAWFEGFSEGIDSAPTAAQWHKIVAKVKQIDNIPSFPQVVYRDRWLPGYSYSGSTAGAAMRMSMKNSGAQEDQREMLYRQGKWDSTAE